MQAVIFRIILRYVAAFLIAKGLLSTETVQFIAGDPSFDAMIEIAAGIVLGGMVEGWYALARRMGWST